ncbi:MAG: phage holin family protein [Bacteroidales bacterium]|jgi:hypothetical protein|nr:phage holin family protein [Bacteroidales bacterium]
MDNQDGVFKQFFNDSKEYIRTRYDLLKLELLEKMAKIFALLFTVIICLVLLLGAFVYFSFALVSALTPLFNSPVPAFLIVGGVFVLTTVIFVVFRKQIFLNPLIKQLSKILFGND